MLKIGDFSKLSRISIRMLRHYDENGLLTPHSVDGETGYRYYHESQLTVAARIYALKEMGFGVAAIAQILQTYSEPQALREYLLVKQTDLQEQADKTEQQLRVLTAAINRLGKDENIMKYSVTVKEMPKRVVASLRKMIPTYDHEGLLWQQMMDEIAPQKVQYANPCYSMAIFHDEGYQETNPDVEIQMAVDGQYENTESVTFKTIEPMLVASAVYKGSYQQIGEVNQTVANWVKDNGYAFAGGMFNIYHVGPAQTQNPDEMVTEVCFPVRKQ